jgi:hypothetical protein
LQDQVDTSALLENLNEEGKNDAVEATPILVGEQLRCGALSHDQNGILDLEKLVLDFEAVWIIVIERRNYSERLLLTTGQDQPPWRVGNPECEHGNGREREADLNCNGYAPCGIGIVDVCEAEDRPVRKSVTERYKRSSADHEDGTFAMRLNALGLVGWRGRGGESIAESCNGSTDDELREAV